MAWPQSSPWGGPQLACGSLTHPYWVTDSSRAAVFSSSSGTNTADSFVESFLVAKYGTMCSKHNINYSVQDTLTAEVKHTSCPTPPRGETRNSLKNISLIKNVPWTDLQRGL